MKPENDPDDFYEATPESDGDVFTIWFAGIACALVLVYLAYHLINFALM